MKNRKKTVLLLISVCLIAVLSTFAGDVILRYIQDYANAPFTQEKFYNGDQAGVLSAAPIFAVTPENEKHPDLAPYQLGWLREEDAQNEAQAKRIENAGYHIFTEDDCNAFYDLLQRMRFRPLNGIRSYLTHRRINAKNIVAEFKLRVFFCYYKDDPVPMLSTALTADDSRPLEFGEIFKVGKKTYLAGSFPAVENGKRKEHSNYTPYSVFEIEQSEALTALLQNKDRYSGGEADRVSRYTPYMSAYSLPIALLIELGFFALALGLVLMSDFRLKTRLFFVAAMFLVTLCTTLVFVLQAEYKGMFRPSVFTDSSDLLTFETMFSDVSEETLKLYEDKPTFLKTPYRLSFADGGTFLAPEEYGENGSQAPQIYARDDWRSYHFSKADIEEFSAQLEKLSFRPVGGFRNMLAAALMSDRNAFAYFERNGYANALYTSFFEGEEPYYPGVVFRGQFFRVFGRTYLIAQYRIDQKLSSALNSSLWERNTVCFSVFEVEESEALTQLLAKEKDYRGEGPYAVAFYSWFPHNWVKGEVIFFIVLALIVVIIDRRRREKQKRREAARYNEPEKKEDQSWKNHQLDQHK